MVFIEKTAEILWSRIGVWLLIGCGVFFTVRSRFYQMRSFREVIRAPFTNRGKGAFGAVCTALGASVGVGNIAGVAAAICFGGAGAVFWMWAAAFFGMMTSFAENTLGALFRSTGGAGGAMYYLRDGIGGGKGRALSAVFSVGCIFASFGIGNISQINAISENVISLLPISGGQGVRFIMGGMIASIVLAAASAGMRGVGRLSAFLVPMMAGIYIMCGLCVTAVNRAMILPALKSIVSCAFRPDAAVSGGVAGVITVGLRRGVFSGEAGMGSSVMVNSSVGADVREQAHMGAFETFFDTIVMCTLTALVILTSGAVDLARGVVVTDDNPMTLVGRCFFSFFGPFGSWAVGACVTLFAFTTILCWSCYGSTAWAYVFGGGEWIYRLIYALVCMIGVFCAPAAVFSLSDIFNFLMLFPNVIGLIYLRGRVREYF